MKEESKNKQLVGSALGAASLLLLIISVFFVVKIVSEVKSIKYVGSDSQSPNVIYVNGNGEVTAVSDIATLYVNVTKDASTAKEAQDTLNQEVTKTLSYLKGKNIDDKDIKSEYGGLSPKYSYDRTICYTYPCPNNSKIIGYTANQSITIKVREVDSSNDIRTGLSNLGITNITGPTFSIDDEDSYKQEARALAIKDAKEKAKVLADDLGVKLGNIVNFSEGGNSYPPMYKTSAVMESSDLAQGASVPELPKGENKITSNVTITYEIR